MEITSRSLWTSFTAWASARFTVGLFGALVELYRAIARTTCAASERDERFLRVYLVCMAALAWLAVLTALTSSIPGIARYATGHGNSRCISAAAADVSPTTSGWHSIGMEWKEHVAWIAPISITMAAAVALQYGRDLKNHPQLRAASSRSCGPRSSRGRGGFFGAMINKNAPVEAARSSISCRRIEMSAPNASTSVSSAVRPNGAGAAAILAPASAHFSWQSSPSLPINPPPSRAR